MNDNFVAILTRSCCSADSHSVSFLLSSPAVSSGEDCTPNLKKASPGCVAVGRTENNKNMFCL